MSEKAADPGSELVEAIRTGLPPGVELDEREEALLDLSARQARDVGTRPWAYWKFELGKEPPDEGGEPARLAELGLLRDDEVAAIAARANEAQARIGTPAEHYGPDYWPDRDAVELHEAVTAALGART